VEAVTVCMTARNAEKTIGASIRSVLRALPRSGRVLVRDDASSDRTGEIVARITDPRLEVLADSSPLGIPASRNELLDRVETPVVAVLDADDRAFPWRFQRQIRLLEAGNDLVFSSVVIRKPPLPALRPQFFPSLASAASAVALLLENPFMHPTMTARTDAVRSLGGYRPVSAEDFDLYLRASTSGLRLLRDRVPTVLYLRHAAQTTIDPTWIQAKTANPLVQEAFEDLGVKTLGFVPSWFAWRRDGCPRGRAPEGLSDQLDAVQSSLRALRPSERRYLESRIARLRRAAT